MAKSTVDQGEDGLTRAAVQIGRCNSKLVLGQIDDSYLRRANRAVQPPAVALSARLIQIWILGDRARDGIDPERMGTAGKLMTRLACTGNAGGCGNIGHRGTGAEGMHNIIQLALMAADPAGGGVAAIGRVRPIRPVAEDARLVSRGS